MARRKRRPPYRHHVKAHNRRINGKVIRVSEHMRGTGLPPPTRPKRKPLPRTRGPLDIVGADLEKDMVKVSIDGVARNYRLKRHPSPYGVLVEESKKASSKPKMVKIEYTSDLIDPRKGKGWVAILRKDENNEIERDFVNTDRIWGKKEYRFSFSGEYPVGTIFEIAEGGSWKNRYRYFYEVTPEGLKRIGDATDASDKLAIVKRMGAKRFSTAWRN